MCAQTCDILTYSLYSGDATSQHTFELARVLACTGLKPTIYSNYSTRNLATDIRPIAHSATYASYVPQAALTVLQYPLWFPLAERFRTAPGARLFWYHGVTPPEHWPLPGERDLLRTSQIRTELASFAHLAVAASPFTARELSAHSGYPIERIRVVPLGVDTAAFATRPPRSLIDQLRDRWRVNHKRVVLYVGRIAGNKRIDVLIDALAGLHQEFPDLHLLVVGDERSGIATQVLAEQLRRRAQDHGISERVTFTGRVPDIAPYYHLADVFVLPSEHEGFGVPLVEAMAAGVPVIASASGAIPWLFNARDEDVGVVDTGAAGLLFTSANVAQLRELLAEVLSRPDLRASMVAGGRRRAQEFDLQNFRTRAALTMFEAIEMQQANIQTPSARQRQSTLYNSADIVQRDFTVTSRLPILGKYIAQARASATLHMKEAYFDRIMEQQVTFNRALAGAAETMAEKLGSSRASGTDREPR